MIAANKEQTCPLGDEVQLSIVNQGNDNAQLFFYNEVKDQEVLVDTLEPNEQKLLDTFRSHNWIVKDPEGQIILMHTVQGEMWHLRIPDSPAIGNEKTEMTFINKLKIELEVYWVDVNYQE